MHHAALKLVSRHIGLMKESLPEKHRELFGNLIGMLGTKNAPLRSEVCKALEAVVKQVSSPILCINSLGYLVGWCYGSPSLTRIVSDLVLVLCINN